MIKKLAKSIREFKLASILCPLFIAGEVTMEVIIPMVMAKLLDEGINYKNAQGVVVGKTDYFYLICNLIFCPYCVCLCLYLVTGA